MHWGENMKEVKYYCDRCEKELKYHEEGYLSLFSRAKIAKIINPSRTSGKEYMLCSRCYKRVHDVLKTDDISAGVPVVITDNKSCFSDVKGVILKRAGECYTILINLNPVESICVRREQFEVIE